MKFVAPMMAGRMAPGIFSFIVRGKERFPGDPWPHQLPEEQFWYSMHSDACRADPAGSVHALYLMTRISRALRDHLAPPPAQPPAPPAPNRWQPPKGAQRQTDLFSGTCS